MNKKTKRKDTLLIVAFFISVIAIFSSLIVFFVRTGQIEPVSAYSTSTATNGAITFTDDNQFIPTLGVRKSTSNAIATNTAQQYVDFEDIWDTRMYQNTIRYFPSGSNSAFTGVVWTALFAFLDGQPSSTNNYGSTYELWFDMTLNDKSKVYHIVHNDYNSNNYYLSAVGFEIVNTLNTNISPSLEIASIEFGNYYTRNSFICVPTNTTVFNFFNGSYFNYISYLDTNGYRYNMLFPVQYHPFKSYTYNPYYYYFPSRTYYTSIEKGDNYFLGYDEGYRNGETAGSSLGYQEGYDIGYEVGKADGFADGVNSTETYTFSRLLFSVLDVPITTLTSLFDYDILGFNLWTFLTSMLTLGIVIYIIRLFTGG